MEPLRLHTTIHSGKTIPPQRFQGTTWRQCIGAAAVFLFFLVSVHGSGLTTLTIEDLIHIPQQLIFVCTQMFPPSIERIPMACTALLQTLEMALVGNILGLPVAFFASLLAAKNMSPNSLIYTCTRIIITLLRTTPSLVLALFLIVAVGLGPKAGALTLAIATIGFCGRFFAETIEEVDTGPTEALTAIGAGKISVFFCAIVPVALPAFLNTALFNLEHTSRSSTILGIVGAGGIGIELMVSIKTFHYDEAATILFLVFVMVVAVERLCSWLRKQIIQ